MRGSMESTLHHWSIGHYPDDRMSSAGVWRIQCLDKPTMVGSLGVDEVELEFIKMG